MLYVLYEVEPSVRDLYVLRMVLQPLVENSILHGLSGLGRKGQIVIRAGVEDGKLVLQVADNSRGMSKSSARQALSAPDGKHSGLLRVGLNSVRSRILLTHGEPYGLDIESREGSYTRVTLHLPVLREKEAADV